MATKTKNPGMILPHKFQKIGWWTLVASALVFIVLLIIDSATSHGQLAAIGIDGVEVWDVYLGILVPILANVTIFLLCLSSECEEDEYIMHLRMGIIKRIACYWFIVSLIESLLMFFAGRLLPITTFSILSLVFRPLTNIYILALVYIIWLKISLYRVRKETARD